MCSLERAIRVSDWFASHRIPPTWQDVCDHFEMSKATAYRWIAEYTDARGIVRVRKEREFTPGLRRKTRASRPVSRPASWPAISSPMPRVNDKPDVELPSKVQRAFVILTKDMRAYHAVLDAAESGRTFGRQQAR